VRKIFFLLLIFGIKPGLSGQIIEPGLLAISNTTREEICRWATEPMVQRHMGESPDDRFTFGSLVYFLGADPYHSKHCFVEGFEYAICFFGILKRVYGRPMLSRRPWKLVFEENMISVDQ